MGKNKALAHHTIPSFSRVDFGQSQERITLYLTDKRWGDFVRRSVANHSIADSYLTQYLKQHISLTLF